MSSPPATMNSRDRHAGRLERLDDHARAERGGLEQRPVDVLGPGRQGQADDQRRTGRGRRAPSGCRCASRARPGRARRPACAAASAVRCSCTPTPARGGLVGVRSAGPACRRTSRRCRRRRSARPRSPTARARCRRRPRRTCRAPRRSSSRAHHVARRGAHDRDHLAGLDGLRRRRRHVGVDVADARPRCPRAARSRRPPRRSARRRGRRAAPIGCVDLVVDEAGEAAGRARRGTRRDG